jgi:glycosyltransferase involved in cell wall biosynthesis
MIVCYFGDYDRVYNRTKVILAGLEEHGIEIQHCNERDKKGFARLWSLWKQHAALRGKYDVLIVGFGDERLLPLFARLISHKPIIWDALFSLYDNWVFDRKLAKPNSIKAYWYWLLDWISCWSCNLVILDTHTNIEYFQRTFHIPAKKFVRVLVGTYGDRFQPGPKTRSSNFFEVEYHGKYIPVQGTDVLVRAAQLLADDQVHITMIGSGQEYKTTKKLAEDLQLENITFYPALSSDQIPEYVRNADACVGLLGDVPRVVRAIPKPYQISSTKLQQLGG